MKTGGSFLHNLEDNPVAAGFVNVPRSGLRTTPCCPACSQPAGQAGDYTLDVCENEWRASEIGKDLKRVRNVKPL